MVRMEWAEDGRFEDRATLTVANRRTPPVKFRTRTEGDELTIETAGLMLRYHQSRRGFTRRSLSATFRCGKRQGHWHYGQKDRDNLGGTVRTLDGVLGDRHVRSGKRVDLGKGLVSRSGWAVVDDSETIVLDPDVTPYRPWAAARPEGRRQDIYLLAYGHDYTAALREAMDVFGRQPLPPRYAFGYWYSRYWAYTDREIDQLVEQFDRADVPLDVMVIDMDWHLPGWTGYTWDARYFPDPDDTLRRLHEQGLRVTLNLHPADGIARHEAQFDAMCRATGHNPRTTKRVPFDITDPTFVEAYFRHLHHPEERRGVDFWWLDWQQGKTTAIEGLDPLPWANQLHWDDMATNPERRGQRPICFSRYGGLGAGRYPVGFSGDTIVDWKSLVFQLHMTPMASNVLYGYWSHDIGGHMQGDPSDSEMYARWVQFGVYSPVLRTHASKDPKHERRFWRHADPFDRIMADAVRRRYELVPYIYSECRKAYDTGVSLMRPMYYDWPEREEAYEARRQYLFGEALLVAPVASPADKDEMAPVDVWLPKGTWFDMARGETLRGGRWLTRRYLLDETPVFARAGTVLPGQVGARRLEPGSYRHLLVTAVPGGDGKYELYEDDGLTDDYQRGKHATIPLTQVSLKTKRTITVGPSEGAFDGFVARRSLEVRLPASAPPRSVEVDGHELPWRLHLDEAEDGWTYDGQTCTVIIRLKKIDVTKQTTVALTLDSKAPARLCEGMAGLLRRLDRVRHFTSLASPAHVVHDEERLAVDLAQAGNRIGRDPSSFARELRRLKRDLKRLPRVLKEFHGEYRKRKNVALAAHVQAARDILDGTLKD